MCISTYNTNNAIHEMKYKFHVVFAEKTITHDTYSLILWKLNELNNMNDTGMQSWKLYRMCEYT